MKNVLKFLATACLLFASSVASSFEISTCDIDDKVSYVGAEIQACEMCFRPNFGAKVFKKQNFGGKAFFGIQLGDYVFVEPGYQYMRNTKKAILYAGDPFFGTLVNNVFSSAVFISKTTIEGPYLDLIVKAKKIEGSNFQPFIGIGVSHTSAKFSRNLVIIHTMPYESYKKFESKKMLRRLIIGANYYLRDDLSIRFSATHINTRKLHSELTSGVRFRFNNHVIPKNSLCYGIGFGYHF